MDKNGKSVWCSLNIENGILTETIPQTFLDTAVYPIRINETFGYATIGGSTSQRARDTVNAHGTYSPAADGNATSIEIYTSP